MLVDEARLVLVQPGLGLAALAFAVVAFGILGFGLVSARAERGWLTPPMALKRSRKGTRSAAEVDSTGGNNQ